MRSSDELADRHAVGVADAEVALQHAEHPVDVADQRRGIEPELGAQRGQRIGLRVHPEDELRRVARQHLEDEEDDDRRDDEARDQRQQAAGEVAGHSVTLR